MKLIFPSGAHYVPEVQPPADPWADLPEYYALPDCESPWYSFHPRMAASCPAIFFTSSSPHNWPDSTYTPYTLPWQHFDKDLLALQKYKKLYDDIKPEQRQLLDGKFNDLYAGNKAWTDTQGVEKPNPKRESLISLGWKYRMIGGPVKATGGRWNGISMRGKEMIRLLSFPALAGPPDLRLMADPMQILKHPAVMRAKTIKRNCGVGNFPHLDGLEVPLAFITAGEAWVPKSSMRLIQ